MDNHGIHQGRVDDSEQPNIMMMTEESGGQSSSFLVENEKPITDTAANNAASHQDIVLALEEDAIMEKHDGSVQKILELFCLMGAGYWRLCQVGTALCKRFNFLFF